MQRITFPLKLQMKGRVVSDLHQALALFELTIADAEKTAQRFGASTRTAVMTFQSASNLPASGEVDEATAKAINEALANRGALDPAPGDGTNPAGRRVTGTVLHADGSPISRLLVQAFHRRVGGELPLGVEAATNDRGEYAIAYQVPPGISKIDLFVRAHDDKQAVVAVSSIVIGAGENATLDLTVTNARFRGPSEFETVTDALRPHLVDANVETVDANDVALLVHNTKVAREPVTAWVASKRLALAYGRRARIAVCPRAIRKHGVAASPAATFARPAASLPRCGCGAEPDFTRGWRAGAGHGDGSAEGGR